MEEDWICPICLEGEVVNGVEVPCFNLPPCNHRFHTACIVEALRRNGANCPMCRGLPDGPQVENHEEINIPNNINNQQNFVNNEQNFVNNEQNFVNNEQNFINNERIIDAIMNYNNINNLNFNHNQIRGMVNNILNNNKNIVIDNNNYNLFRNLFDAIRDIQNNNIHQDNYFNYINNNNIIINH